MDTSLRRRFKYPDEDEEPEVMDEEGQQRWRSSYSLQGADEIVRAGAAYKEATERTRR